MVATTITFDKVGIQPPVYVAGVFTGWVPTEMKYQPVEKDGVVENHFSYTADLEPGEYQYKFRLGPGDWWVLDESTPTTDDGVGNINNILTVKPQETKLPADAPAGREPEVSVPASIAEDTHSPNEVPDNVEEVKDTLSAPEPQPSEPEAHPQPATFDSVHKSFDGTKEDTIPDVAPPPYEELHAAPAGPPSEEISPALSIGIEKKPSESRPGKAAAEAKETAQSWFAQKPVLIAAIVVVPVIVSWMWYR